MRKLHSGVTGITEFHAARRKLVEKLELVTLAI